MASYFEQKREIQIRFLNELAQEVAKRRKVHIPTFLFQFSLATGFSISSARRLLKAAVEAKYVNPPFKEYILSEEEEAKINSKAKEKASGRQPKLDSEAEAVFRSLEKVRA